MPRKKKLTLTQEYTKSMADLVASLDHNEIDALTDALWEAYENEKTIFIVGNGGSASTATHLAADIAKNTLSNHWNEEEKRFKAFSLTDNVAWITALGNDQSHENIFIEQLKNFASEGDVLFVISGSGNSPNVVKSAVWAKQKGIKVIGMLGFTGGYLKDFIDTAVTVNSNDYGLIESIHGYIHHAIAASLMARLREKKIK